MKESNIKLYDSPSDRTADVPRVAEQPSRDRHSRLVARAIVFAALLLAGVGVLAIVAFSELRWVIPLCIYAVFVLWAKREFF